MASKTPHKPNIIGETGPQPVTSMDGSDRWDDVQGMPLLERKLALGFANANAGVLHWDWTRSDSYGLLRRDGSQKQWMDAITGVAAFAREAQGVATEAQLPDVALVIPQSLLSIILAPGRAALLPVGKNGKIRSSCNVKKVAWLTQSFPGEKRG